MSKDTVVDGGYPVSEAAEIMGITPGALRKRIQRGTVDATKVDGQWYVYVEESIGEKLQQEETVTDDVALVLAQQQMEVFRETFVTPLVEAIRELENENGRLESDNKHLESDNKHLEDRADQLIKENDELHQRIRELETPTSEENDGSEEATGVVWWRRWLGLGE